MTEAWQLARQTRINEGKPDLGEGTPFLLKIDEGMDIDKLKKFFGFEIVAEHEDGYIIIASENLSLFEKKLADFAEEITGSATVAEIHEILDPQDRLRRILSTTLFHSLSQLNGDTVFICDVGVSCSEDWVCSAKPDNPRWKAETRHLKQTEWQQLSIAWTALPQILTICQIASHFA